MEQGTERLGGYSKTTSVSYKDYAVSKLAGGHSEVIRLCS
jgi:hypothetical protein